MTAAVTLARVPRGRGRGPGRPRRPPRLMRDRNCRRLRRNFSAPPAHRSCDNWQMSDLPGRKQPPALSVQLADARKRGIERLDVESHNQHRLEVPGLDELAARYAAATRSRLRDRVPRLKYLLRD